MLGVRCYFVSLLTLLFGVLYSICMAKKIVHSENEQLNDRPKMNCRRLNLILPVFIMIT